MSTRPTNGPLFAGGANPSTWPTAKETNGYAAQEKLPAEDFNGIVETHGDWIDHLERGGHHASLDAAVGRTAAGESFLLDMATPYTAGDDVAGSYGFEPSAIAIDAERFYIAFLNGGTTGVIRGYPLSTTGDITAAQVEWTGPGLSGSDTYTKIVSNGVYLGAIFDTEWHVYDCTDGTLVYSGDHTAALRDVAISENYMMVVGVADGSNICARVIDLSDGSSANVPTWGTSLDAFCCAAVEDELFFIAAEADGSSNRIGAVSVPGGVPGYDWRANTTRAIASGAVCTSNGRAIFLHNGDTGAYLTSFSPADGSENWERNISATLPNICCDVKDVWLALNDIDALYAIDAQTGATIRTFGYPGAVNGTLRPPIACNSVYVVRGCTATGSLASMQTITSGLRTRRWTREALAPHFNQATPEVL